MHTALNRLQNAFGFSTTVAFGVAVAIFLSSLTMPQAPSATLEMRNVQVVKGRPHYYSSKREEYAHIKFDLDLDLSSLYNWNTKQVFVYVAATYPSADPSDPPATAIIWDAIIPGYSEPWHHNQYIHYKPSPSSSSKSSKKAKDKKAKRSSAQRSADAAAEKSPPGIMRLKSQRPKYQITDVTGKVAERANCTLELGYNVQPWVGPLWWASDRSRGLWGALKGARSRAFDLPAIRSKDAAQSGGADDLKTMKGAEANRGMPA